jgi:hypothetical protein
MVLPPFHAQSGRKTHHQKCGSSFAAGNFLMQPGTGIRPIAVGSAGRKVESGSSLVKGQAGKVSQFDEFSLYRIMLGQSVECFIHGKQVDPRQGSEEAIAVQLFLSTVAASLQALLAACTFDKDTAHSFRGGGEEVSAIVPFALAAPNKAKVRLVNQGGRLKRLAGLLLSELPGC